MPCRAPQVRLWYALRWGGQGEFQQADYAVGLEATPAALRRAALVVPLPAGACVRRSRGARAYRGLANSSRAAGGDIFGSE
jgi:hypothetical protein